MSAKVANAHLDKVDSHAVVRQEASFQDRNDKKIHEFMPNEKKLSRAKLHNSLNQTLNTYSQLSNQLNQSVVELETQLSLLQSELIQIDSEREDENSKRLALENRLEFVLDTMPVAVILLDGRGVVSHANKAAQKLLDCRLEDTPWIRVINHCFSPEPTDGHEVALKDGRLVSIATQSLGDGAGQIVVLTDQTETRQLQAKINHNRKLSEMGRMAASLAHQVRTPLSTAVLYADHLANPVLSEERRLRYADKLKSRLQLLERQVSDMLVFSNAGITLQSTLSITELKAMLEALLNERATATSSQVRISVDKISINRFSDKIRCNQPLLSSVFYNLMDNAIQACQQIGIQPTLWLHIASEGERFVSIELRDNGPGVGDVDEAVLLEPFFTTKESGTGLGLAVAKAVTDAHGGHFSLVNRHDGGACARMLLPILSSSKVEREGERS